MPVGDILLKIYPMGTAVPHNSCMFLLSIGAKPNYVSLVNFGFFFIACIIIILLLAGNKNDKPIPADEEAQEYIENGI